jgi:hypothetical protein
MYKLILSSLALVAFCTVSAQQYQYVYSTPQIDLFQDAIATEDQGYLLAGSTSGGTQGGTNGFLVKTDAFGERLWSASIGGSASDGLSVLKVLAPGVYLAGGTTSSSTQTGTSDISLVSLDEAGELLWSKALGASGEDQMRDVAVCANNDLAVLALTRSFGASYDVAITRLTAAGDLIWSKAYGTEMYDAPLRLVESADGSLYVWGHQDGDNTQNYDAFLMKVDPAGNLLWSKRYQLSMNELAWDMLLLPDGDLLVSGDTNSEGAGLNDIYVMRLTPEGEVVWANTFGGFSNEHGIRLEHMKNDTYAVVGATSSFGAGGLDYLALFISAESGSLKYATAFGGVNREIAHGVVRTADYGLLIAGESRTFGDGLVNAFAVKVNQDGSCACNNAFSGDLVTNAQTFITEDAQMLAVVGEFAVATADFLEMEFEIGNAELICTDQPETVEITAPAIETNDIGKQIYERMTLHPNPSTGPVTAALRVEAAKECLLRVFNLEGKLVFETVTFGEQQQLNIQLPQLPKGIYLVRMQADDRIETKRLIING